MINRKVREPNMKMNQKICVEAEELGDDTFQDRAERLATHTDSLNVNEGKNERTV